MRRHVLFLAMIFVVGFANNVRAEVKGRIGLTSTKYCLEKDTGPTIEIGFGTKESSLILGLAGHDTPVFSLGVERSVGDLVFVGLGLVIGKTFNYQNTGENYNFARPVFASGVNISKFYVGSKFSLTGGYREFNFGIRLK